MIDVDLRAGASFTQAAVLAMAANLFLTGALSAQDSDAEKQKLAKCEKDICSMIVGKRKDGPDLSCDLTKTWSQKDIQKGADEKHLAWGFGNTKCSIKVDIKRSTIVSALTSPEYDLKLGKQTVRCDLDRGADKYPVKMTFAPELKLKDGKATEVSLHVGDIEGAALIKGVVWTAATLEQNFGILQGDMLREINKFIEKECPGKMAEAK